MTHLNGFKAYPPMKMRPARFLQVATSALRIWKPFECKDSLVSSLSNAWCLAGMSLDYYEEEKHRYEAWDRRLKYDHYSDGLICLDGIRRFPETEMTPEDAEYHYNLAMKIWQPRLSKAIESTIDNAWYLAVSSTKLRRQHNDTAN